MEIWGSARKRDIPDADILHAFRNPIVVHRMDGYRMFVGPGTSGELLEVAVADRGGIFHAMQCRPKYLPTQVSAEVKGDHDAHI